MQPVGWQHSAGQLTSTDRCGAYNRNKIYIRHVLTDEVGENENHPLASLMDVLGVLIEKYEDDQVPEFES